MHRLKSNPDRTQCKGFGLKTFSDCNSVSKFCGKNIECVKTLIGHVLANKNPAGRFQQKKGFALTLLSRLTAYHIDLHSVLLWFVVLF